MKLMQKFSLGSFSVLFLLVAQSSTTFAFQQYADQSAYSQSAVAAAIPTCSDTDGRALNINNLEVITWKKTTKDQYQDRSLVQGVVTKVYSGKASHNHFAIDLNGDNQGDLEVIYNTSFGALPEIKLGMTVIACGDYITVGPHARLPSPMGAIIHWVHYNPGDRDGGRHPHGFLVIQGKTFGFPTTK